MKELFYTMFAIPFLISMIILYNRIKEKQLRRRRRDVLEKYNKSLIEKENQDLKMIGYYKDPGSSLKKGTRDFPDHFTGGNLWI